MSHLIFSIGRAFTFTWYMASVDAGDASRIEFKSAERQRYLYARIGLRYDISKQFFVRASVRLYQKFYSDFIEWGVGYSYYKVKK